MYLTRKPLTKSLKIISLYALVLIIFLAFFRFFVEGRELFEKIKNIDAYYLIPQVILAFLFLCITAYMNAIILKSFHVHLRMKEWFGLGCINALSNFIFPLKIGTMVKALYLKNKYGFYITHSLSVLFFATFIKLEIDLILSALFLGYTKYSSIFISPYINLLFYFSCLMFPSGIVFILVLSKINLCMEAKNPFLKHVIDKILLLIDGMNLMIRNSRLLAIVAILSVMTFIIQVSSFYFAYLAIGKNITVFNVAFVYLVSSITELLSVTPSNLGIREVVISLSSKAIGCSVEEGFVVAAIIRIAAMANFITFGTVFLILFRKGLTDQSIS
jgi:uncharacterized protein (TIRG00374 family)